MDSSLGFLTEESFRSLLHLNSQYADLEKYILRRPSYAGRDHVLGASSSYRQHEYDLFFYALIRVLQPERCVELGVLEGFSLLAMASGLRDNGHGHITGYDLFDMYPYRHSSLISVEQRCRSAELSQCISLSRRAAEAAFELHSETDILHIDLSNDGDTYRTFFSRWANKVKLAILLEGGTAERDAVSWMRQFCRPPIVNAIAELRVSFPNWLFVTLAPFPGMTVAFRR